MDILEKRTPNFYLRQLELADKHERRWRERAKKIVERYRDESKEDANQFNILWSNTQTQLPALYSSTPRPDVRRRWKNENDSGREISRLLERALSFSLDSYNFDGMATKCILDILLPGRMVARVRYHPFMQERIVQEPSAADDEDAVKQEDGTFLTERKYDELIHEEVRAYHVPWKYYRQAPEDCWDDVWWVAYGNNFLTKEEIVEQFGDEHENAPLVHVDRQDENEDEQIKRAQVWEIWDKDARQVVAVIKGYDRFLMVEDDPLGLDDFYPQPEPAMFIETPDSSIPIPEYTMYQVQAEELESITKRINNLIDVMRARGFVAGEDAAKLNQLMKESDNTLIPVDSWAAFAEKGGMRGVIDWMPIKDVADVWQRLSVQREQLLKHIYELIGISDIQRGMSDPRETRGAQQLKANFGSRRLLPKLQRVEKFFRDILRIKAEIIAENFQPETLRRMTGVEVTDEMVTIMRSDALRSFAVDVETESTVAPDDEKEKQGVAEFMNAMASYLQQVQPIVAAAPSAIEPVGKMLLWMSRKFKIARDVEDEIEQFIAAFKQQMAEQQQREDPEVVKAKAEAERKNAESQAEQQRKNQELQAEEQRKNQETENDIRRKNAEAKAKLVRDRALLKAQLLKAEMPSAEVERIMDDFDTELGEQKVRAFEILRDAQNNIIGARANKGGKPVMLELVRENGRVVGGRVA